MEVSNSSESSVLKFEDVTGFDLGEDTCRGFSGEDSTLGLALNTEERGRKINRGNNKI